MTENVIVAVFPFTSTSVLTDFTEHAKYIIIK